MWKSLIVVAGVAGLAYFVKLDSYRLFPENDVPGMINLFHGGQSEEMKLEKGNLAEEIADYDRKQVEGKTDVEMVNQYYNVATDFYEYGWGQSFHFAHTGKDEGHDASIQRHETRLAEVLGLKEGDRVLDCGCGVGGPARQIAKVSGAFVKGVTLNNYQVARANKLTNAYNMVGKVEFEQGDFTKLNEADESFDDAYAIEATCHAPTLESVYGEVYRILKKGGKFASYEWITAKDYDPNSATHNKILKEIEYGNGLPPLRSKADVLKAAKAVGFKLVSEVDLAQDHENTRVWYHRLQINKFQYALTHATCWITELLGLSPKGTLAIHGMLLRAAYGLVDGGEYNVFTPMHLFVFEKI